MSAADTPRNADPAAQAPAAPAKGASSRVELARYERTVARRAAEIRATVPHLELRAAAELPAPAVEAADDPLRLTAALVRASALALREVPRANASPRGDEIELHARVNVGVTLTGEDHHAIATVFDADGKDAAAIHGELRDLSRRAREGELAPPELAGGTFTVWDLTPLGLLASPPLVISPQAAALTLGLAGRPPGARNGGLMRLELCLACDHRILYGAVAARFLNLIRDHLEHATP